MNSYVDPKLHSFAKYIRADLLLQVLPGKIVYFGDSSMLMRNQPKTVP